MPACSLPCALPPSTGLAVLALMLLGTQPMSSGPYLPPPPLLRRVFGVPDPWRVVLTLSRRDCGFAFAFVTSGFLVGSAVCHRVQ